MTIRERIDLLAELGHFLEAGGDAELDEVVRRSFVENRWFTEENTRAALGAIARAFLDAEKLAAWAGRYDIVHRPHPDKTVALIMAGNIPLVGFHDWLCVFVSGRRAQVKLSEKDRFLLPFLVKKLGGWAFESWEYTGFLEEKDKLRDFDAVIATGSNNTARYFEQYFGKYPHIIRRNRNGVAVLRGTESLSDLYALGRDVFAYFGLGCRNVSKLYVPRGYDFSPLLEALHEYRDIIHHDKYKNNFDYNLTLCVLNNVPYQNNGCLLLLQSESLSSRIASVHFEYYDDEADLLEKLEKRRLEIQCVAAAGPLPGWKTVLFGETQTPALDDYPDRVDILDFLLKL